MPGMNSYLMTCTVPYPDPMHPLDLAFGALVLLRERAALHPAPAQQTLRLVRLEAALRKEQTTPDDAAGLFRETLSLRGAQSTAADPAWRTVICALAGYAFSQGVPASDLIQAIRADQLASDMRREPRLYGEPLVVQQGQQLQLHPDIVQVRPEHQHLN